MAEIEIEIDGRKLTAQPNQTVIQVADEAGIYIPRFCYHKQLSIPANCRMCIVEIEKAPKALPACATPVAPGMKVFTKSQKTIVAQRAVMEFLLINHPLDCPICDQGGECELQDLAMGYGSSHSHYNECKRSIYDENLGPLISTDMTRCIYCTRCVRFGDEIAGLREMGATYRGEDTEIGTYVQHAMQSEVSGNIIDLCPVGALTSKPFRFKARAWELQQHPSIAPHDCLGSNINVHTLNGKVMRVVSRENMAINEMWLSDRDRFAYTGLYHADRYEEPIAKINGSWQVVDWETALEIASKVIEENIAAYGADKLAALASPNSTLEEFYLLQKLVRGLGSPHVDYRLRASDTSDQASMPLFPGLALPIAELENCDAVVLIGSNLQKEQPLAALRVRKAAKKGAFIVAVNPADYDFNFTVQEKYIVAPHHMVETLEKLVNELPQPLQGKQKIAIVLGALAANHSQAAAIRYYAQQLAEKLKTNVSLLLEGANAAGAWLAGAVPHRHAGGELINHVGHSAHDMLSKPAKTYLLLNVEPDLDCSNAHLAIEAMKQAKFVVALSMFRNPVLEEHAHVILPIAPFTETSGTFINAEGKWQHFKGVAKTFGASRPAWKVLRVLGNFLNLEGFEFETADEVCAEIKSKMGAGLENIPRSIEKPVVKANGKLSRIGEIPIYAVDSLVRRAMPLQAAQKIMLRDVRVVRMHSRTANEFKLSEHEKVLVRQGAGEATLSVAIDDRIPVDALWVAGGIEATRQLGDLMGEIRIEKLN